MKKGKVFLVGGGPGDPGLITVKGLEVLKKADVVVYDRLISPNFLNKTKPNAKLIYAGKSPQGHVLKQEEINEILASEAEAGNLVVRLKGGDGFIFGRGGEEAQYLKEKGIDFEVVPGVSSAYSAPAYAGIPLTHRDYSSSFAVITGHETPDKKESRIKWDKIADGIDTLVFLMGVGNIKYIAQNLIQNGKDPETPAALIRWGTRPEQDVLVGKLENIAEKVKEAGFKPPAVIVIGKVVELREQLAWLHKKPLSGKRVLVTRSRKQASELSRKIYQLGGEPWEFPVIKITPPDSYVKLDKAIEQINLYDWIIFTSVNGVDAFFERLINLKKDVRNLAHTRFAVIGSKTAEKLKEKGITADVVPPSFKAEDLIQALKNRLQKGDKVLIARASIAREILPNELKRLGADVTVAPVYRTVLDGRDADRVKAMLKKGRIDILTFTSSSTVKNFMKSLNLNSFKEYSKGIKTVCIGPITASTAEKYGFRVDATADPYTIEGLIKCLVKLCKHNKSAGK